MSSINKLESEVFHSRKKRPHHWHIEKKDDSPQAQGVGREAERRRKLGSVVFGAKEKISGSSGNFKKGL